MKKIGFLSFGHWSPSSHSQARSVADTLLQSIDLAGAAEELGAATNYSPADILVWRRHCTQVKSADSADKHISFPGDLL